MQEMTHFNKFTVAQKQSEKKKEWRGDAIIYLYISKLQGHQISIKEAFLYHNGYKEREGEKSKKGELYLNREKKLHTKFHLFRLEKKDNERVTVPFK